MKTPYKTIAFRLKEGDIVTFGQFPPGTISEVTPHEDGVNVVYSSCYFANLWLPNLLEVTVLDFDERFEK